MKFNPLETKRLNIRQLVVEDANTISHYRSDSKVSEFQSWDNYSESEALKLINEMEHSAPSDTGKWFQFGIELLENRKLIGDIGFLNSDENNQSWIGFTLSSEYWQRGYASEAVEETLKYYKELGVSSAWASIDPQNHRSRKLLQKLGFTLVEEKPDDLVFKKEQL